MKSALSTAKVSSNCFIDLDVNNDANNILLIGNTTGFFGYYTVINNEVCFDSENTGYIEKLADRIMFIKEMISKGGVFTIIGPKETIDYYRLVFTFFRDQCKCKIKVKTQINIKTINNDAEYIDFIDNKLISENMKFDYIIQNPPYSGSLHLNFMNKGLDMLSETGKMTIIEPATWLINVRKNGKVKLYDAVKERLGKHIYKVVIENLNKEFNIGNSTPLSITYIDYSNNYDNIIYTCCGETKIVKNLNDCNLIGDYNIIKSILNKLNINKPYFIKNLYLYSQKKQLQKNAAYIRVSNAFMTTIGSGHNMKNDKEWIKDTKNNLEFTTNYITSQCVGEVLNTRPSGKKGNPTDCIYFNNFNTFELNKEYLENYKNTVLTSLLFHFISICIIIDEHGADKVLQYIPMLDFDHVYSDEELYKLFNISKDEQELIKNTCIKFDRNSNFIKNYWKI